jgi:CRP-like cAMP-binding protein
MDENLGFPPPLEAKGSLMARLTRYQRAQLARGAEIFSEATVEQLFQVAGIARDVEFAAAEIIFQEGTPSDAFYIIAEGEVELASLEKNLRNFVRPGHTFGLYGMLAQEPRRFTATALTGIVGMAIPAESFYGLLSDNTEIAATILTYFARKCLSPHD